MGNPIPDQTFPFWMNFPYWKALTLAQFWHSGGEKTSTATNNAFSIQKCNVHDTMIPMKCRVVLVDRRVWHEQNSAATTEGKGASIER